MTSGSPFTLVVTGASGYLGQWIIRRAQELHPEWIVHGTYFSHPVKAPPAYMHALDLRDPGEVNMTVDGLQPDWIIHTAALMGDDGLAPADSPGAAFDLNANGTKNIAHAATRVGARLIHLSTDVIFDGTGAPYTEESQPHPIHRYGASKLAAEQFVQEASHNHVIVRTSLSYGREPTDPRTQAMLEGRMVRLFVDEFRSPIWVYDLAEALLELCPHHYDGILNVAGPQRMSRYELGLQLVEALGGEPQKLVPAHQADSALVRPRDCTLVVSRAQKLLRTKLHCVADVMEIWKA